MWQAGGGAPAAERGPGDGAGVGLGHRPAQGGGPGAGGEADGGGDGRGGGGLDHLQRRWGRALRRPGTRGGGQKGCPTHGWQKNSETAEIGSEWKGGQKLARETQYEDMVEWHNTQTRSETILCNYIYKYAIILMNII